MEYVPRRLEDYAARFTTAGGDVFDRLAAETSRLPNAGMSVGAVEGAFLSFVVFMKQPQRVLEIGTFTGHSALSMAAALPEGGRIDACELDPERARFAQSYFDRSPHGSKIELHVGPALDTIASLEGDFDLVFLDADKEGYVDYYDAVVPRLSERGLIVADNTLWGGRVRDGGGPIVAFNDHVAADPRSVQVVLSVRDGMTLIRRAE